MDRLADEVRQESLWSRMFADDNAICRQSRKRVEERLEKVEDRIHFFWPTLFFGFFFKAIVKINTCLLFTDSEEADVLFHNKRDLSRNRDTLFLIFCSL